MVRNWIEFNWIEFRCFGGWFSIGWIWWEVCSYVQKLGWNGGILITEEDNINVHKNKRIFQKKHAKDISQSWVVIGVRSRQSFPLLFCIYLFLLQFLLLILWKPSINNMQLQPTIKLSVHSKSYTSWRLSELISINSTSLPSKQFRHFLFSLLLLLLIYTRN